MSATAPVPRFLLPRGAPSLRNQQHFLRRLRPRATAPASSGRRHASTQPNKPLVLEKPEKFNPPSHPSRLRTKPRAYPGPALSEAEKQEQKTKRYPHMMPPEGTFTHWFLTNKMLHTWITLSTLFTLAFYTILTNFKHTSPYASDLPPGSLFLGHPVQFLSRYFDVYRMHTAYVSAQTAERRRKKVEDVQKRAEFRKAHGIDQGEGFGGWTAKEEGEGLGPALGAAAGAGAAAVGAGADEKGVYTDFEGRKKPVKKWLGIW